MSTTKQDRKFIRIRSRQRTPDFVRKAGPMRSKRRDEEQAADDQQAGIQEWADSVRQGE